MQQLRLDLILSHPRSGAAHGALVGGASLKAADFSAIVTALEKAS